MYNKKGSKREHQPLSIEAKVNAFAIKIYDEQLPDGIDALINAIRACDKSILYVLAICHDRDEVTDGIWAVALEKRHYHVLVKYINRKTKERVSTILKMLHIVFRKGLDDLLLKHHGIETIGNFTGYCVYLTHETEDAIKDNKEFYDISEIISNLNVEEIKHLREGYLNIANASEKITLSKLAEIDKLAFELGHNLGDFSHWYNELPFNVRCHSKIRTIQESYDRGVQTRLEEGQEINRLCIYIQGAPNTGKTYAVKQTLKAKRFLTVGGGGSGKFDKLRPDHEAIIVDDDIIPNLLNMSDNYICYAYRRNSRNPVWAGELLVVTSNLSFDDWITSCGIKSQMHHDALATRFFICTIEQESNISRLALVRPSTRGSIETQIERADKFVEFQRNFNTIIASYQPTITGVNFDSIIDHTYLHLQPSSKRITENIESAQKEYGDKYGYWIYETQLKEALKYEELKSTWQIYLPKERD